MKRDLIFVFFGGAMSGLFGGGVATAFEKADLYPRIYSIYAISAGAHNAAYFLSKDTIRAASIYYLDLTGDHFIKEKSKFGFWKSLLLKIFLGRGRTVMKYVDMDYLLDIEKYKKRLDTKKILNSPIKFYVRAFNVKESKMEYLNAKTNIFKKIKASSAIFPFYPSFVHIRRKNYIDGNTLLDIDKHLEDIVKKNPHKKVIFVINHPLESIFSFKSLLMNFGAALFFELSIPKFPFFKRLRVFNNYFRLKRMVNGKNVFVIDPDYYMSGFTHTNKKLTKLYWHGVKQGADFIKKELGKNLGKLHKSDFILKETKYKRKIKN